MPKPPRAQIQAQIAALQAELAESDAGVYEDPATGRWFVILRAPGRRRTTTRRRGPDGRRLRTRAQALKAKGQWGAQLAGGGVAIARLCAHWRMTDTRPCAQRIPTVRARENVAQYDAADAAVVLDGLPGRAPMGDCGGRSERTRW